jgi:2'-hydroxybiphenyl-2-sulfinate desulfinase
MSVKEFLYTICPVGNASYISANKGFLQKGFEKLGVKPIRLQTLPEKEWHVHYDYESPALFREGGNIPPIWSKSEGREPVLIGIAFLPMKSYILVRIDSNIDTVEQLRGKRIGIPTRPEFSIDFFAASALHGLKSALVARDVSLADVKVVELPATEAEIATKDNWKSNLGDSAVQALDNGRVDAIYSSGVRAQQLLSTGKYTAIYEVSANPNLVLPTNNCYPNILTVSKKLADDAPEIVVEYVKQVILAAEWAKTNLSGVVELFSAQLNGSTGDVVKSLPAGFHKRLTPSITTEGLLALEGQKRFLLESGYIKKDFDIEKWADDRFLKAAWKEIEKEGTHVN